MAILDDNDPFASVDFNTPLESVGADELVETLKSFGSRETPFMHVASAPSKTGGIERVNASTGQTGAVAYKDAKGQTVLTNVAKDATGKEVPIVQPNKLGAPASTIQSIDSPLPLNNILTSLSKVTDSGAARGLFASFQEAAAVEQIRIETEAKAFASNKLGVSGLESQLAQAEAADKADPEYYPGRGDSPITQGIRRELNQARGFADVESKRFLETNLSYKLLAQKVTQAQAEMTRVQRGLDRAEAVGDNIKIRSAEYDRRKQEEEEAKAETISSTQLARVQLLSAQDFVDEPNPRVKAHKLLTGNKDKNFQAAVNAEASELPMLAVKGNAFAATIFMAEESANTGMPQAQIAAQLASMKKAIESPKFVETMMKARFGNDKKAIEREVGNFNATAFDPNKKQEVADAKVRMAFEWIARKKTETYLQDTSSWDSIDPAFKAAQDQAAKVTGKRDLESTLTAFLGDSVGPERLQKAAEFDKIARIAAQKHSKSMFGMPDYRAASKLIADKAVTEGIFKRFIAEQMKKPFDATTGLMLGGPTGAGIGAIWDIGNQLEKAIPLDEYNPFTPKVAPINPLTNKPFGE